MSDFTTFRDAVKTYIASSALISVGSVRWTDEPAIFGDGIELSIVSDVNTQMPDLVFDIDGLPEVRQRKLATVQIMPINISALELSYEMLDLIMANAQMPEFLATLTAANVVSLADSLEPRTVGTISEDGRYRKQTVLEMRFRHTTQHYRPTSVGLIEHVVVTQESPTPSATITIDKP